MAQDDFSDYKPGLNSPAIDAFDITPNDTDDLVRIPRALYVGTGGTVKVDTQGGSTVTFQNVASGSVLPLRIKKLYEEVTTAGDFVGLV